MCLPKLWSLLGGSWVALIRALGLGFRFSGFRVTALNKVKSRNTILLTLTPNPKPETLSPKP